MAVVVEAVGEEIPPVDGRDLQLSLDSKVQFFAYQRVRDAVAEHKAKAGSVVVLDAQSGEVLALANYPSYAPSDRRNLTGEQLRNRAMTDVFEPGSTVKPMVALALLLRQPLTELGRRRRARAHERKRLWRRDRPGHDAVPLWRRIHRYPKSNSFPSGHSASA